MHILFANTGVQLICVPLPSGRRYTTSQIGYGWQYTRCVAPVPEEEEELDDEEELKIVEYPYIQWQIIQSHASKLYIAVDTTMGDPEIGYFCDPTSLHGDFVIHLENFVDLQSTLR